ncbi:hypothetical protein D3OALGA1CA_5204 [Olavius algarvensis associated proteobacterium Delta 3]|nr:hypothetical protein D3OALGA1CA_5204 [Olavius algarvensis associated proteobacterium Delta 3]
MPISRYSAGRVQIKKSQTSNNKSQTIKDKLIINEKKRRDWSFVADLRRL